MWWPRGRRWGVVAKTESLKGVKAHTRYCLADGTRVPGATTIVGVLDKPALVAWANRLGLDGIEVDKYRDALADVGTCVHHMILCDIKGEQPDLSMFAPQVVDLAENSYISYLNWRKAHKVEPILCEQPLVSAVHRFGGTPDFIGTVDGMLEIGDFKSGSGIYAEHFHQVAGGYLLLAEEHGYKVEQVRLIRIPRDETEGFEEHTRPIGDCLLNREMFLLCRRIYELQGLMRKRYYQPKAKQKEVAADGSLS